MDNRDEVSNTDIAKADKKSIDILKVTQKPKAELLNPQLDTSRDSMACSPQKEVLDNESFSFEKEKLRQLKIENNFEIDVNDESIAKLKIDIFKQFERIFNKFEKLSKITRILTVVLLFIEISGMIGMFFMLLYLSLMMVPIEQILFWVGSSLGLSLAQMFLLMRGIASSQSKEVKTHKEYIYSGIVLLVALVIAIIIYAKAIISNTELFGEELKGDARNTLRIAQILMFIQTMLKAFFQIVFFILEWMQIKNLNKINKNNSPLADPPSQNYMLDNKEIEKPN